MSRTNKKIIIMRITWDGNLEVKSFVNYDETPTEIIPKGTGKAPFKKGYLDYMNSSTNLSDMYRYELISRDSNYADMKARLVDWAIMHDEMMIKSRQTSLANLSKL